MSTLKVNTVQHNTTGFNNVVQFTDGAGTQNGTLCRAWVRFDGSGTVTINASFNVSSITDDGTGQYRVNFSSSFSDREYCFNCSTLVDNSSSSFFIGYITYNTASTFGVGVFRNTVGFYDADRICCSFFR